MASDLKTVEGLVAWLNSEGLTGARVDARLGPQLDDDAYVNYRAELRRIAKAIRLLEAWEKQENKRCAGAPMEPGAQPWTRETIHALRAALEEGEG